MRESGLCLLAYTFGKSTPLSGQMAASNGGSEPYY